MIIVFGNSFNHTVHLFNELDLETAVTMHLWSSVFLQCRSQEHEKPLRDTSQYSKETLLASKVRWMPAQDVLHAV